jgi:hypothetical protein
LDNQIQNQERRFEVREKIVIVTVLLLISLIIWGLMDNRDTAIRTFVASKGEKVVDIDAKWIHTGPFWATKNTTIYRVETDKSIYWFRFGLWKTIKQEVNGKYIDMN